MVLYTISTVGIRWIQSQLPAPQQALLNEKYVAFVSADGQGDTPASLAALYTGMSKSFPNQQTVGICITADGIASLFLPVQNSQNAWYWPGGAAAATFSATFVTDVLKPAGGIAEVPYCVPRGFEADMRNNLVPIRKLDGMPFYCRDTATLYIYDTQRQGSDKWMPVTGANDGAVPIGGIITFPHVLLDNTGNIPASFNMLQWLPTDGREISKVTYNKLYAIYGDIFGSGALQPPVDPLNNFRLPIQVNGIVRSY